MNFFIHTYHKAGILVILLFFTLMFLNQEAHAQIEHKWLNVGSMHNFYSSPGVEREHALFPSQQFGLRWPAIYQYQDMQAAKAMWFGVASFTDERGEEFSPKMVHVGPRSWGTDAFYPIELTKVGRFPQPNVFVDGNPTFREQTELDEVDPSMAADRMIVNRVNTSIGLTMERRIMQFSQEHHDNYHITEFTFTNTGNVNNNDEIELPNQTLEDLYIFFQQRLSVVRQTRYLIGNATGWGINAMIDRIGDGQGPDYGTEELRGHFVWHGNFPPFTDWDNIGAPIITPTTTGGFLETTDTTGRLGAYHFVGNATIHADTAPNNDADDLNQPGTMTAVGSDDILNSNNDQFNRARMQREYDLMKSGRTERHAFRVEPSGDDGFKAPSGDPSLGTSGGWSAASGYGPYTLGPGESITLIVVEGASGISRELAEETGRAYKNDQISALEKNEVVFQGRDSLMQTFNRAQANYRSGYSIPRAPLPPSLFQVNSGGDGIFLDWEHNDPAGIEGFEIYRANGRVDSTYYLIYEAGPNETSYADDDFTPIGGPVRGRDYYYYIVAVGDAGQNDGTGLTPSGALRSSRFYTQTYDPARLQRPAGEAMSEIRVVPNPYHRGSSLRLGQEGEDRIAFYDVPGRARIRIFTELGELVETIHHSDGSGDTFWDATTSSQQKVASGVYIVLFEDLDTGERATRKLVIIR